MALHLLGIDQETETRVDSSPRLTVAPEFEPPLRVLEPTRELFKAQLTEPETRLPDEHSEGRSAEDRGLRNLGRLSEMAKWSRSGAVNRTEECRGAAGLPRRRLASTVAQSLYRCDSVKGVVSLRFGRKQSCRESNNSPSCTQSAKASVPLLRSVTLCADTSDQ